jgi:hypothetical protein
LQPKINGVQAVKKKARPNKLRTWPPTTRLIEVWNRILANRDAQGAFEILKAAGFPLSHLQPTADASFKNANWSDYIAAIPLVPNEPTKREIRNASRFRKSLQVVQEMREVAAAINSPFDDPTIYAKKEYPSTGRPVAADLSDAATVLEHFLGWNVTIRRLNCRDALIAELRWTIRDKSREPGKPGEPDKPGRPHDRELGILIDAAYRAAGYEEGCYIDPTALERIEERQKESRVKSHRRANKLFIDPAPRL